MTQEIMTGIKLFPMEGPDDNRIGYIVAGEGIYMGLWGLREINLSKGAKPRLICSDLNTTVHAFAALNDLTRKDGSIFFGAFNDAAREVITYRDRFHNEGSRFEIPKKSYEESLGIRLLDGSYDGGWVIPTQEMLVASDYKGRIEHTMYDLREIGDFRGALDVEIGDDGNYPTRYWSCSIIYKNPLRFADVRMSWDGSLSAADPESWHRCRPVRFRPGDFSFG